MPTYEQYVAYAASKGFQPVGQKAFNALVAAGFNPVTKTWAAGGTSSSRPPVS